MATTPRPGVLRAPPKPGILKDSPGPSGPGAPGLRPARPDLSAAVANAPRGTRLLEPLLELGCVKPRDLAALGRALLDDARWSEGLDALALAAERAPADAFDNALWPRDVRAQAGRAAAARALAALGRVRSRPAVRSFVRSRLLQHLDRADEAAAEFRAAAPLFTGCPWYFHGRLGELLVKAGRMRRALAPLARAAALAPAQARPLCWRAEALYWLGDRAGAARGFAAARRREPRSAGVAAWHGQFLLWTGRTGEARKALEAALALDAEYAWAWAWLGSARMLAGEPRRALADVGRALALDPGDLEARLLRAECLMRLGRRAAAAHALREAARLEPDRPWLHLLRALHEASGGSPAAARGAYARARQLMPGRLPALASPAAARLRAVVAGFHGCRVYRPVR